MRSPIIFTGAIAVLLAGALLARPLSGAAADQAELAKPVFAEKLPNVPGKTLTEIVVTYAPDARSAEHHHAGSVFACVLSGDIRSQNSASGPARIYHAGEAFFEPGRNSSRPCSHFICRSMSSLPPSSGWFPGRSRILGRIASQKPSSSVSRRWRRSAMARCIRRRSTAMWLLRPRSYAGSRSPPS